VQKSAPDGHTLLMAPRRPWRQRLALKSLPYDPVADFALVGLLSGTPFVLMVNVDLPVARCRSSWPMPKPIPTDEIRVGRAGVAHHMFMEVFKSMTGMKACMCRIAAVFRAEPIWSPATSR